MDHLVELDGGWRLWRDFAVRSAGFPVSGLDVFGPGEGERLVEVARDPRFQEAVAWQSRESLTNGVLKLARGAGGSPSRRRRWEDIVAGYWQRYCSKNDTIGFFGPLAWGEFGDRTALRAGGLERERVVHFETWAMEAVAGRELPMCPFPERHVPPDTPGLDRLLAAREAVAGARDVAAALDELDRVFEAVTGRPATRTDEDSGGGRTIAYLDCMRDCDVTLGPEVLAELRASLPRYLSASRWWCGRVFARGAELLGRIAQPGPLAPQLGPLMGAGFGLWDQMGDELEELQRRWRNGDEFADWTPAWHGSNYQSPDLQIAAPSPEAISRGDFLIVLGDFHGGDNPLGQGLFGHRHPVPGEVMRRFREEAGPGVWLSPPRRGPVEMRARSWPMYPEGDVVIEDPGELVIEDGQVAGVPLAELLYLPIFVAAIRSFDPIGPGGGRVQAGKLVLRRASWTAPPGADLVAWASEHGLPRRAFARSPSERKPRYVDFESPSLTRILERWAKDVPIEFTEMLPGHEDCWLDGHTSELRMIAV